ncbi:twitching motility protein PilT [Rhizobium rhizosphaerae]|uniref:Twitching motility protein PilT n=1 Tax=Xaviernesmea rhizosphaerae TaxID=1672749 RepID=A0A1Q9AM36_9HYPH|nr:type II toxin-antitoxin system VapC family toxin [Xaviernesmea rhizosphaerae]OLP56338.1 twitching motility protein PilT [Xaviernesmea rhizosphaerae]
MIAIDTSVLIAIFLEEPEAEKFKLVMAENDIVIGWPTLFETRTVLAAKRFLNPSHIITSLSEASNVTCLAFDRQHYRVAEQALQHYGKGRHPAGLNMGDCFSYAVSAVAKAPLLFKGRDFSQTDLKLHPASSSA